MSQGKYRCRQCGAPLELFATLYSRSPIEYLEVQCSEDADHDCGFIYRDDKIVERH
jgi:DNA-directed RNA polymerase subunit RPC12/RpoP